MMKNKSIFKNLCNPKTTRIFVNPKEISRHLYCTICRNVFEEPMRLECGHTFCYICINAYRVLGFKCPVCKTICTRNLEKDLVAYNIIDELIVFCNYQDCSWKGTISSSIKHHRLCEKKPKNTEDFKNKEVQDLDHEETKTQAKTYVSKSRINISNAYTYPSSTTTINAQCDVMTSQIQFPSVQIVIKNSKTE